MRFVPGLTLAFVFPLFFLVIVRWLDFYKTGQPELILLGLVWGGFAFALGTFMNNILVGSRLAGQDEIISLYAPIHEEIFKGLILLYLIRLPKFTYSVDGAVYGFAVGIGFAIVENFYYITIQDTAVTAAWQRIFSANLVHASSSATLGIALGIFRFRRTWLRWVFLGIGLFLAIGQHMFYNTIDLDSASLVAAFGTGFIEFALIYLVMQFGKKQAQHWIRQKLGMADRVTRSEARAVDRLANTDDALLPVLERFGAEKTSQVEQLLYLQARLGLKRKTLDSLPADDKLHTSLEAEISKMQTEMESMQRKIGTYVMLFVRGLFTDEMISVWDQVQAKVRERSALNGSQKGGGLWTSIDERIKAQTDAEPRG